MDRTIYGAWRIAEYLGKSVETLRRLRKTPRGAFIEVGSCACDGGRALWSYESSLDNLLVLTEARTSDLRRSAALKRWQKGWPPTDCTPGTPLTNSAVKGRAS